MLKKLFNSLMKEGSLTAILPGGRQLTYGTGEPHVIIRLHDRRAVAELALNPDMKLGELYMDGRLTIENGDAADLLALLMRNLSLTEPTGLHRASRALRNVTRKF